MTDEQQNIKNDAPNQGVQGQFHGDVNTGAQQDVSGERAVGIGGDSNAPVTTGGQSTVTTSVTYNEGIIVSGGQLNSEQTAVGRYATAVQNLNRSIEDFRANEQQSLAQMLDDLLKAVDMHKQDINNAEEVVEAIQQIMEEVRKEKPNTITLKSLLNGIESTIASVGSIGVKIVELRSSIATLIGTDIS